MQTPAQFVRYDTEIPLLYDTITANVHGVFSGFLVPLGNVRDKTAFLFRQYEIRGEEVIGMPQAHDAPWPLTFSDDLPIDQRIKMVANTSMLHSMGWQAQPVSAQAGTVGKFLTAVSDGYIPQFVQNKTCLFELLSEGAAACVAYHRGGASLLELRSQLERLLAFISLMPEAIVMQEIDPTPFEAPKIQLS